MTSVVANKIGLDIVDIQISQTGGAETDMFFQEPVLDKKKDYVVGVSELSVPLTSETPLSLTQKNLTDNFLEVRRRVDLGQRNLRSNCVFTERTRSHEVVDHLPFAREP